MTNTIHKNTIAIIRVSIFMAVFFAVFLWSTPVNAAVIYWDGGGVDNNWSTALNWNGDVAPGSSDIASFDATSTKSATINANINVAGIDIISGYTGTITQATGVTMTIGSSGYLQADGKFMGGDSTIDINSIGDFTQTGGEATSTSGTLYLPRNITISGGTFYANNGTIQFDSSNNKTVNTGTAMLNNVIINAHGWSITVTGTMDVNGNLTITDVYTLNGGTIAVAGNVVTTNPYLYVTSTGSILFDGTGNQTLSAGGGEGRIPGVTINKPSGTLTIYDTISVRGSGISWTHTAGTVNTGTSTVQFLTGSTNVTVDASAMSFNNVIINAPSGSLTVTGTMDVNGDLTITGAYTLNGGTIAVAGNVVTTVAYIHLQSTGSILFDGTGDQTLSAEGGTGNLPGVTINKTSGTLTIYDSIIINGNVSWTHTAGTVNTGTSTIQFTNSNETIDASGMSFNNVILNSNYTVTVIGTMDVNGDLTISMGWKVNGGTIAVAGDVSATTDTSVGGTTSITLDGTGLQLIDSTTGTPWPAGTFTINKSSGTAKLVSDFPLNEVFDITSGTFDQNGFDITLNGGTIGSSGTWLNASTTSASNPATTTLSANVVNNGVIYWNGGGSACGDTDDIALISSVGGTQRSWSGTGTTTAKDIDVKDMGGTSAFNVISGTDSGGNGVNWTFTSACDSSVAQSASRWFANTDSVDVGTPLSLQDARAVAPAKGVPFRLRAMLHISDANLLQSGENFKLQYAKRVNSCTGTNHVYSDVSPSSGFIRFADNGVPADGATLTANSNDPNHSSDTTVVETYEESNNFTNSVIAVNTGQDGLWDFALVDNSTPTGNIYCFRAVKADGGALLDSYSSIAEISTLGKVSVRLTGKVRMRGVRLF